MKSRSLIAAIVLYLLSTGVSFAAFRFVNGSSGVIETPATPTTADGGLAIDPGEPKTQACPLNGQLFTQTEENAWVKRRPLTVMIENSLDARPQSGLGVADVVYEAIAEGGVTRFMGVFYCDAIDRDYLLAPIRSARTYFINWASEYGRYPLYVHVGGANCSADGSGACQTDKRVQALEQIESYGWGGRTGNDMNQFSIGYPTFYRDANRVGRQVATEHTMVTSTEKLWELAESRGWTNLSPDGEDWTDYFEAWDFKDDTNKSGSVTQISYDFWDGFKQFDALWQYDAETKRYLRSTGGEAHKDLNTNEQLAYRNIVVLFTKEEGPVDTLKHMYYETMGSGNALVFNNGEVTEATWKKASRTARTTFTDKKGQPVEFARGPIWISIVDNSTQVSY